jgi:hypothetical protein
MSIHSPSGTSPQRREERKVPQQDFFKYRSNRNVPFTDHRMAGANQLFRQTHPIRFEHYKSTPVLRITETVSEMLMGQPVFQFTPHPETGIKKPGSST